MGGALVVFFGVDLFILVIDAMDLGMETMLFFYGIMLVPMIIFYSFYQYENHKLVNKYLQSSSKLDLWILILILIRDAVFVLNVIPFIQVLGGIALVFGGMPYLIVYSLMIRARNKSVATV